MIVLPDNQEGFVQSLLKGDSQRKAYRDNYKCPTASDKTIDEKACRLLAKDKVWARYNELKDKLREKAEEEGLLSATEVLKKITELIERNENEDDKTALEGLKTYGKHLKLFTDKVEVSVKEMPAIVFGKPE